MVSTILTILLSYLSNLGIYIIERIFTMSSKFKKILFFIINLFLYFVPSLIFRGDNGYYKTLNKAFVPPIVFMIARLF